MASKFTNSYTQLLSLTNLQLKPYTDSKAELEKSLARTKALLKLLGSPENILKFVHITGTSGKGSVANMVHQMLTLDSRKVGTYTSPHTTTYLERFQVGDKLISPNLLAGCISDVIVAYSRLLGKAGGELSFFELSTVLALYAFHKAGCEWCVLEVGCGGRFDATNVIPTPEVAVITNIDKDHTQILGDTLAKIAYEKAGIIKRGGTVLCGETRPAIRKIFMKEAIKTQAALFFVNPPNFDIVDPSLGAHQQHNAALAKRTALELDVDQEVIAKAMADCKKPPCRFEIMQQSPMIVLDGAHSPAKIKAATRMIKMLDKPVHILFGCTAAKDADEMLDQLNPVAKTITTTRFTTTFRKAANPAELLLNVEKSKRAGFYLDPHEALEHVRKITKQGEVIVVTGSLYLAGELRQEWITEAQILKKRSSF
ncbi:MAG: Mur ligase family protein [bacterium]